MSWSGTGGLEAITILPLLLYKVYTTYSVHAVPKIAHCPVLATAGAIDDPHSLL